MKPGMKVGIRNLKQGKFVKLYEKEIKRMFSIRRKDVGKHMA